MYIYFLIFALVFCISLIIFCCIFFYGRSKKANGQHDINLHAECELRRVDFNMSRKIILSDYATWNKGAEYKMFIGIDDKNKKLALVDYNLGSILVLKFDELLNYEVYENNSLQASAMGVGGFIGIMGAETTGQVKDLRLIIRLKNMQKPQVCYDIVSSSIGIVKTSGVYRECVKTLQEATSLLEVILNENKNNQESTKNTD